jgi:hypothetical protein
MYVHHDTLQQQQYISDWQVFQILDHLHPTATGMDKIPAWFLRVGAPVFCEPLAHLFNLSLATSQVPIQWKTASILPVPKVTVPTQHSDFRPISITPVLTRIMERTITSRFLYPSFNNAPPALSLDDQYAFRPTGSTTAALIQLLNTVTSMLTTNKFVVVLCLDFSKAFDTVRHSALTEKLAQFDLPDNVYNWLADYFNGHSHCTHYRGDLSSLLHITASIIQGSAIGPPSYVVCASDLKPATSGNEMVKFADDSYIIIPSSNVESRQGEVNHAEQWALKNNLKVNVAKYMEVVFYDKRSRKSGKITSPPTLPGIKRVSTVKILGVTLSDDLSVEGHVHAIISSAAQTLHALRVLRGHGMDDAALQTVFRSVVVAKLQYASCAWWGFSTVAHRQKINAFIHRSARCRFVPVDLPKFDQICRSADETLFRSIVGNHNHVLFRLLPPPSTASQNYNLRRRFHNLQLPARINYLNDCNFINRMLYANLY